MITAPTEHAARTRASLPKLTIAMLVCGIVSAAGIRASSAATADDDDVMAIKVKYDPSALSTDQGARALYHRLEAAAQRVCPLSDASLFVSREVRECREQAVARAVFKINHPNLVAVYTSSSKHG
jgi:UrcA family protein